MGKKKFDFEKNVQELEKITDELSQGELPLDYAIEKYAEGIKTFKACSDYLAAAEKKVTQMTKGLDGTPKEEPFEDKVTFEQNDPEA